METERSHSDSNGRVLLLDGDREFCAGLCGSLAENGIAGVSESDGATALASFKFTRADLVVLDLAIPNKDGLQLCREIRASSAVPILVHTARNNAIDHVLALELGADDFVPKPIEPRVLVARIKALLRRVQRQPVSLAVPKRIGHLCMNRSTRSVAFHERRIDLTGTEFDLLWLLFNNCGEVVTRDEITRALDKRAFDGLGRAIDGRVFRLRRKLVDAGANPGIVRSARSAGYLMVEDELRSPVAHPLAA